MQRPLAAIVAVLFIAPVVGGCSTGQTRDDAVDYPRDGRGHDHSDVPPYTPVRGDVGHAAEPEEDAVEIPVAPRKRYRRKRRRRRRSGDLVRDWRHGAEVTPALIELLDRAEAKATPGGREVLKTGRRMVLDDATIVRGSCWTYASAVYKNAGIGRKQRKRVFKTRKNGPYIDPDLLQPGDFLSYINFSYNQGVHSAIFVGWLDRSRTEGLMLSYVGSRRARPGDYRSYRLTHVYAVYRPR